jgi:putative membrane protein
MSDLGPLLPIAGIGVAYAIGLHRMWALAGRGRIVRTTQATSFAAGLIVTAAVLVSPLDSAAGHSLTAHMVQHVVLLSVSGPLLALGAPLPTLLWALTGSRRQAGLRWWRRALSSHRGPAWYVWAGGSILWTTAIVWVWHAPALYQGALHNEALHGLEHLMFLSASALQWWALAGGHRARRGMATLAVFIASLPATGLSAAMLLAPRPWYPDYVHTSLSGAMSDQQLAAVVMWSLGGLVYVIAACVLFGTWLNIGHADELPVRPLPFGRGSVLPVSDPRPEQAR